jgi:hypothetical protein
VASASARVLAVAVRARRRRPRARRASTARAAGAAMRASSPAPVIPPAAFPRAPPAPGCGCVATTTERVRGSSAAPRANAKRGAPLRPPPARRRGDRRGDGGSGGARDRHSIAVSRPYRDAYVLGCLRFIVGVGPAQLDERLRSARRRFSALRSGGADRHSDGFDPVLIVHQARPRLIGPPFGMDTQRSA